MTGNANPLPLERHRYILGLLGEHGVLRVAELSELLGVSEVTVRRDLEALERKGLLERTRGGAVSVQRMRLANGYQEAAARRPEEKRLIGQTAAALIEPGDTVVLNEGTTTREVMRHITAPNVTVVTNHAGMASEELPAGVELILTGGHLRPDSGGLVGAFARDTLNRINANRAFIGVEGVSLQRGLTTPWIPEAEIASLMIERTRGEVTVVADHSKLGMVGDFVVSGLAAVHRIVIDAGVSDRYHGELQEIGIEVTIAGEPADE